MDDNSAVAVADNPVTEPVGAAPETGQPVGQASEQAPNADLFNGIDPKTLPPVAKAAYDSMLRDYREKTSRLSETVKAEAAKATEAYRTKAEQYDQIAAQEAFVTKWNQYVEEQNKVAQAGGSQEGDPVLAQMKQQLQEMNQKMQLSEMSEVTNSFADAVDEKGVKLHPEFDTLNNLQIGKAGGNDEYSLLRGCVELAQGNTPTEKLLNGYKNAKMVYDSIFELGKKAGMGRLQSKVMNGTIPPSRAGGETLSVTDKKPKSAFEAMALARKGIMVSRE